MYIWEVRKQKLYGECTHIATLSVSPWLEMQGLSLGAEGLGLVRGIGVSWAVWAVNPLIVVGVWSVVFLLRQHVYSH